MFVCSVGFCEVRCCCDRCMTVCTQNVTILRTTKIQNLDMSLVALFLAKKTKSEF